MRGTPASPSVIEYQSLVLPYIAPTMRHRPHELRLYIERLIHALAMKPVEITGPAPLFLLLPLYMRLQSVMPELVYRENASQPAHLLFSILDEARIIRPSHIQAQVITWSPHEEQTLARIAKSNTATDIVIDFSTYTSSKELLTTVYAHSPNAQNVVFRGDTDPSVAIEALQWFMPQAKRIAYEDVPLFHT